MTHLVRPPLSEHFRIILRSLKGSLFSLRECRKSWFFRCFSSLSPVFLISMMWIMVAPMLVAVGVLVNKLKGSKDCSGNVCITKFRNVNTVTKYLGRGDRGQVASQPAAWSQPGGLGSTVTIRSLHIPACSLHPPHPASPRGLQPLIKPQ